MSDDVVRLPVLALEGRKICIEGKKDAFLGESIVVDLHHTKVVLLPGESATFEARAIKTDNPNDAPVMVWERIA